MTQEQYLDRVASANKSEIVRLREQRDELLAACEAASQYNPYGHGRCALCDTHGGAHEADCPMPSLRAAIAKAGG